MSDSLRPHEWQHTRPPCLSQTPGVYPNSCPSSRWCHPASSSSVVPFLSTSLFSVVFMGFSVLSASPGSPQVTCKSSFIYFFYCIMLQYSFFFFAVGFVIHWHEPAMELHVFPILIPLPTSLSTQFLWVFPVHQARALVSCIPPGLVICFTLDHIHAALETSHPHLLPQSPKVSSVHLCLSFCFAYKVIVTIFLNSIYMC